MRTMTNNTENTRSTSRAYRGVVAAALMLVAMALTLSLGGCGAIPDTDDAWRSVFSASSVDILELRDANGSMLATLKDSHDVTDFVDRLHVNDWELDSPPDDAQVEGTVLIRRYPRKPCIIFCASSQRGRDADKPLQTVATMTVYADEPYLTLHVGGRTLPMDLDMRIPAETADSLRARLQEH